MSGLLSDPRVTVHIGDGFRFLADNKGTYDVIITDSSDPVGPAEALFQKAYFQLLYDALAPGGYISNQAECLWLHLEFIADLRKFTSEIFQTTEYAYCTIPTYPSGQIGFILCAKEAGRDLRTPIREVTNTRYYNKDIHRSAFVLPEFAKLLLDEGKDIRPLFGRAASAAEVENSCASKKKILLLGSGFVARPCVEYIVKNPTNLLTIGKLMELDVKTVLTVRQLVGPSLLPKHSLVLFPPPPLFLSMLMILKLWKKQLLNTTL